MKGLLSVQLVLLAQVLGANDDLGEECRAVAVCGATLRQSQYLLDLLCASSTGGLVPPARGRCDLRLP